jgi:hypothetical protein
MIISHLTCEAYVHWLGSDPLNIAIKLASFGLKIVTILCQIIIFPTSIRNNPDSLQLKLWYSNIFQNPSDAPLSHSLCYDMIYLLTATGLSPGGSSTHLHTNNT